MSCTGKNRHSNTNFRVFLQLPFSHCFIRTKIAGNCLSAREYWEIKTSCFWSAQPQACKNRSLPLILTIKVFLFVNLKPNHPGSSPFLVYKHRLQKNAERACKELSELKQSVSVVLQVKPHCGDFSEVPPIWPLGLGRNRTQVRSKFSSSTDDASEAPRVKQPFHFCFILDPRLDGVLA